MRDKKVVNEKKIVNEVTKVEIHFTIELSPKWR